jgi:hypothetical protein
MSISKQGDWISAKVGAEIVMMSVEQGKYIGLNEVGARIWDLLDTPQSVDSLCIELVDEFDVAPDACRSEVEDFLTLLGDYHAIARA